MTNSQRLALRLSEVRQKLNELVAIDAPSDEQRAELTKLTAEYPQLETQYRAALVAESDDGATERRNDDAEDAEVRQLVQQVELSEYMAEAATGREATGVAHELRAAVFGDEARPGLVPWAALLPAGDEARVDAESTAVAGQGTQQSTILERVFANTAAAFLGVSMPQVGVGDSSFPVFSSGATGELKDKGVVKDAQAATITGNTLTPKRISARYLLRIEDAARLRGLEESMRADLSGALGEAWDKIILTGDGTAPNPTGFFDDGASITVAADPGSVDTYDSVAKFAAKAVDGRYARNAMGVCVLFGVSGYQFASGLFPTSGDYSATDYLAAKSGGVQVSAHVPAVASNIQQLLLWRKDMGMSGVELIRDPYTNAAKGQVAVTAVMLADFAILRTGAYRIEKIKSA